MGARQDLAVEVSVIARRNRGAGELDSENEAGRNRGVSQSNE